MKRDFGVRRTHLRGQRSVENDLGLVLMAMNLTKLGKIVAHMRPLLLKNGKNRTTIFEKSKIMVRFSILNVKIKIVYSQPLCIKPMPAFDFSAVFFLTMPPESKLPMG